MTTDGGRADMETSATTHSDDHRARGAGQPIKRSWRAAAGGALLALFVPLACLALAWLAGSGLVFYDPLRALVIPWFGLVLLEVALGPIGIAIALWSAGVRGTALAALIVLAVPVLGVAWLLCIVTLSGAMGEPF
jgi:hypothetical protein